MRPHCGERGLRAVLLVTLTFILAVSPLSAAINSERIYPTDSEEYRYISWLSLLDGISMPSSSGPWSGSELRQMLGRIDRDSLDPTAQVLYDRVRDKLDRDSAGNGNVVSFEFGVNANVELSAHTNPGTFTDPDWFGSWRRLGDFNRPSPLVEFPFGFAAGDNIFAYTEIPLGMNRSMLKYTHYLDDKVEKDASGKEIGRTVPYGQKVTYDPVAVRSNLYLLPPSDYMDIDLTFPWRAYLSIGGDWWNFTIGKDRLSMGPGVSGNLMIGDHIPFHNNARFSFFSDRLKYTFSISSFIHPDNYIVKGEDGRDYVQLGFNEDARRFTGAHFFMVHRFESRWDKVSFALNEAVMYRSDSGADLALISPMSVFHNLYMRSNGNSLLSLEFEYDFGNIDWYNVLLVDDFNFPGEHATKAEPPMAIGLQTGLKGAWTLGNGILHSSLEAVVTSPYLYLRDDGSRESKRWGINFVVDFPEFNFKPDVKYPYIHNFAFIGYRYGNDAITADFQIGWESLRGLKLNFDLFYMAHGVRDMFTRWEQLPPEELPNTPSTSTGVDDSYLDPRYNPHKDAVSHTLDFSFYGEYPFEKQNLSILSKADFLTVFNYGNRSDGGTQFDFQFMLGVRYSY